MDNCLFVDGGIVTTTMCIENGTTLNVQVGLVQFRKIKTCGIGSYRIFVIVVVTLWLIDVMSVSIIIIIIVTITTGIELTNKDFLCIGRRFSCCCFLGTDMHIRVPSVIHTIRVICQFCRQFFTHSCSRTNGSWNIITTIDVINDNITWGILSIDVHIGVTTHIGHTGTTKHFVQITLIHRHFRAALHFTLIAATIYVTTNRNLRYAKWQMTKDKW